MNEFPSIIPVNEYEMNLSYSNHFPSDSLFEISTSFVDQVLQGLPYRDNMIIEQEKHESAVGNMDRFESELKLVCIVLKSKYVTEN